MTGRYHPHQRPAGRPSPCQYLYVDGRIVDGLANHVHRVNNAICFSFCYHFTWHTQHLVFYSCRLLLLRWVWANPGSGFYRSVLSVQKTSQNPALLLSCFCGSVLSDHQGLLCSLLSSATCNTASCGPLIKRYNRTAGKLPRDAAPHKCRSNGNIILTHCLF